MIGDKATNITMDELPDAKYTRDFKQVQASEANYIKKRRREAALTEGDWVGFDETVQTMCPGHLKDYTHRPIGLALSGGGIRSATFALGVLQSLSKAKILKFCDYLSTVSGGGYIGSCLTSLLNNDKAGINNLKFPFRFDRLKEPDERQEVKWLRKYANYLFPNASFFRLNTWNFIGLFITGIIVINIPTFYLIVFVLYGLNFIVGFPEYSDSITNVMLMTSGWLLILMVVIRGLTSLGSEYPLRTVIHSDLIGRIALVVFFLASFAGLIILAKCLPMIEAATAGQIKSWMDRGAIATGAGLLAGFARDGKTWFHQTLKAAFLIAQLAILPIAIAETVQFLWTHDTFCNAAYGLPNIVWIAIALLVLSLKIDLNRISMHHFYRTKLSKAYLISRNECEKLEDAITCNDQLELRHLHEGQNGAPYHILNATANLPASVNRYLRGRGADYFVFSKFYCGSESTGYRRTEEYERGRTKLSTAMAVSGAAVSPQNGFNSKAKIAFLYTLLNARLNRWMENPDPKHNALLRYLPYYYLKELLRWGSEKSGLLNISDGGHTENLGIYQLLKRRCAVIIASDAGADPDFRFEDLANVIAKARIDLGIEINLSLDDLRQDAVNRYTKGVVAVGKISYPEGSCGVLIYLKACITGRESEDILSYRKSNPGFPDQSTADQFFDEAQFESYRELGYLIVKKAFEIPTPPGSPAIAVVS